MTDEMREMISEMKSETRNNDSYHEGHEEHEERFFLVCLRGLRVLRGRITFLGLYIIRNRDDSHDEETGRGLFVIIMM